MKLSLFKKLLLGSFFLYAAQPLMAQTKDEAMLKDIYKYSLTKGESYEMLRDLTKNIGARLSGSPQAAAAVEWGRQLMETYNFDTVWLQPVMVPRWVRGGEDIARVLNSSTHGTQELTVTALGNTTGTGPDGLKAEVIEVKHFEELEALGEKGVKGKIVFFNYPMKSEYLQTFQAYGDAAKYRTSGPSEAAQLGAVGAVVRSLTTSLDDVPHTGTTRFGLNVPQIPAIAVSTQDAEMLSEMLQKDKNLKMYMETHGKMLDDVLSYNVIGEIRGSEKPDEYIVVGGHLDSWDLAEGAHDDGTGIVQSVDALRILDALGYQPRHTLRAVMFMNEENGLAGGREYAEQAEEKGEKHVAALESDSGGFTPIGFSVDSGEGTLAKVQSWKPLFEPYQLHEIKAGYGGADISPLKNQGTPLFAFRPDSQRYFDYHHTPNDVFENVNKRELELGTAAMASLLYLIDQHGL
ncbi:M28 family peptidase [Nafulsella turpanensis]|uniref:M28 family peptidase n=1 Tax=Nafulsella turpanensis TaxID=1265690 RepID=UPI000476FB33|nr:M28 family peptidase [Nafulsella turpanensis]